MPSIQEQSPDQARPLLISITQDERVRSLLLSSHAADAPRREDLLTALEEKISKSDPASRYELYCESLNYLGCENCSGGQDGRDALAMVFPRIAVETSSHEYNNQDRAAERLTAPFIQALDQINPDVTDVYGSFDAIMRAGLIVATEVRIVQNVAQRNEFVAAVKEKAGTFLQSTSDEAAIEYGSSIFETFQRSVIFGDHNIAFQDQGETETTRPKPVMNKTETLLHDRYLETVNRRGSMKQTLWNAVPNFRNKCLENGIDLARFWNQQDPDYVAGAIETLKAQSPKAYQQVRAAAGKAHAEVFEDQDMLKVHADQVYAAAQTVHDQFASQGLDINQDLTRIAGLIDRSDWRSPKAKAKFQAQIAGLAKKYGLLDTDDNKEIDIISIHKALATKQESYTQALKALSETFDDFQTDNHRFAISGRNRSDMFLSDETGDCTAYHLECGMNGQTVPVWLSMPNFVISTIHNDEGNMLAKLGLLIGWRDNQPCLVIDSIESSRLIPPGKELESSMYIDEGLSAIIAWGRSIGLPVTYGYSFNNSSELIAQIEARSVGTHAEDFELFGGLDGLHEYMKSIDCAERDYRLHLQTYEQSGIDDGTEEFTAAELLAFESAVNSILYDTSGENRKQLAAALDTGEYGRFTNTYLRLHCGDILSFLDITPEELYRLAHADGLLELRSDIYSEKSSISELLEAFRVNEDDLDEAAKVEEKFENAIGIVSKEVTVYLPGLTVPEGYRKDISDDVKDSINSALDLVEIEELLGTLAPEEAFSRIFGSVNTAGPTNEERSTKSLTTQLKLNSNLPQIIEK